MRILDRQRYWAFLKAYCVCFIALVGLYVVIHAFTNLDEFNEVTASTGELLAKMGWYYLIHMSEFYDRLCGVLTMMAAIFTVTWMQRNNELLAMLAAGVSTRRVIRPVLISAILVSGLAIFNQEYVIPSIGGEELQKPVDAIPKVHVYSRYDVNGVMVHGHEGDRIARTVTPFNATTPEALAGSSLVIEARDARFIPPDAEGCPERGGWLMRGVVISPPTAPLEAAAQLLVPLDDATVAAFPPPPEVAAPPIPAVGKSYFLRTNVSFEALTRNRNWYQYATTIELIRGLFDPINEPERLEMEVFLHGRLLRPVLSLALLMLSLPIVLGSDGRNMFINLGLSLATSALFYGLLFVTGFLGRNGVLTPELAAWLPLFVFGTVAVARWDRIRT